MPAVDVAAIRARARGADARACGRDRADDRSRSGRVRGRSRRAARPGGPLGPLRAHVVGHRRHVARASDPRRGRSDPPRHRSRSGCSRAPRRGAPPDGLHRPVARDPRGADDVRVEARGLGLRARPFPVAARTGPGDVPRRPALGNGRDICRDRSGGRTHRLRAPRPRARPRLDAGDRPRPPRRAALRACRCARRPSTDSRRRSATLPAPRCARSRSRSRPG